MGNQVAVDMPDDEISKDKLISENTQLIKNRTHYQNVVESTPLIPGDFCTTIEPLANDETLGTVEINEKVEQIQEVTIQEVHTDSGSSLPSNLGSRSVEGKNMSRGPTTEESQPLQNAEPLESPKLSKPNNSENDGTGSKDAAKQHQNVTVDISATGPTIAEQPDTIPRNNDNSKSSENIITANKEDVSETKVEEHIKEKSEDGSQFSVKIDTDSTGYPELMLENSLVSE